MCPATYAWVINSSGTITLGWVDSAGFTEATYDGSAYASINLVGAYDFAVHSINTNGDVVYTGIDSDSGLIVGRFHPTGSTDCEGYKGMK